MSSGMVQNIRDTQEYLSDSYGDLVDYLRKVEAEFPGFTWMAEGSVPPRDSACSIHLSLVRVTSNGYCELLLVRGAVAVISHQASCRILEGEFCDCECSPVNSLRIEDITKELLWERLRDFRNQLNRSADTLQSVLCAVTEVSSEFTAR